MMFLLRTVCWAISGRAFYDDDVLDDDLQACINEDFFCDDVALDGVSSYDCEKMSTASVKLCRDPQYICHSTATI